MFEFVPQKSFLSNPTLADGLQMFTVAVAPLGCSACAESIKPGLLQPIAYLTRPPCRLVAEPRSIPHAAWLLLFVEPAPCLAARHFGRADYPFLLLHSDRPDLPGAAAARSAIQLNFLDVRTVRDGLWDHPPDGNLEHLARLVLERWSTQGAYGRSLIGDGDIADSVGAAGDRPA